MSKYIETCCVADQSCIAPANLEKPERARCKCFSCGLSVCSQCSSKRKYHDYGKVRLCNNCQVEYDGNDKIVMKRLYRKAGLKWKGN